MSTSFMTIRNPTKLEKVFIAFCNSILMMKDRGYNIDDDLKDYLWKGAGGNYEKSFDKFNRLNGNYTVFYLKDEGPPRAYTSVTIYPDLEEGQSKALSVAEVKDFMSKVFVGPYVDGIVNHSILISFPKITGTPLSLLSLPEDNTSVKYEIFEGAKMLLDPIRHRLAPKYRVLRGLEAEAALEKYNGPEQNEKGQSIRKDDLPKIHIDEAIVKRLGLSPGDFLEIRSYIVAPGGPATESIEVRIVSSSESRK